jgi:LacI family transcriptional regulator
LNVECRNIPFRRTATKGPESIVLKNLDPVEGGTAESAPKYLHVSKQLEERLLAGEWQDGRVPTVRGIAEAYQVSIFTASRALHVLQDKGLIQSRERSGCYVVPAGPPTTGHWGLCLRVSPGAWRHASEAVVRVGFDRLSAAEGETFRPAEFEFPDGLDEAGARRQVRDAMAGGMTGLFYLPSRLSEALQRQDEALLAGCRREGLPVVLLDRNLRGEDRPLAHDLVSSDHFDGGLRSTRHLLDLGRRTVACVVASPTSTHNDRVAGYLYAAHAAGLTPRVLHLPADDSGREAFGWLADRLVECKADGAICYQDYTAMGLILELLRRGVRVPGDLAVVGCDDLPIGTVFSFGVTSYAYPSDGIARRALRVMHDRINHPDDPPVKILVPGRLVVRDSTAPA